MNEMTDNPDYRLVMDFLQSINPGDMDEESAEQLMKIGQRIEGGGQLSDQEREMFMSVVGAMPMNPGSAVREGEMGQMGGMPMDPGSAVRFSEMAPVPMHTAPSRAMTVPMATTQGGPMNMQEMIDAGIISPKRPQTRPTAQMESPRPRMRPEGLGMQSPRPRMRPDNLGG